MKKNQFYIGTGLQLINAIEYIYRTNKQNEYNELILSNVRYHVRQEAESILHMYKWSNIKFAPSNKLLKCKIPFISFIVNNIVAKFDLNKAFAEDAHIILGHNNSTYCKYIAKKVVGQQITLLDDGVSTINYDDSNKFSQFPLSKKLQYLYFGLRSFELKPDRFFTSYVDILRSKKLNIELIENEYEYLKSVAKNKPCNEQIYFIGDPLVEKNIITDEDFFKRLKEIKDTSGRTIIYIPRKNESAEKLAKVAEMMKVVKNDVPFELFLLRSEQLPKMLIGYHSTVLFNVHKIFGDAIELKYMKLGNCLSPKYEQSIEKIYSELGKIAEEYN